jgi:hypothetical protein
VDNVKINLRETGWGGMDWINLADNELLGIIKCWEVLDHLHNWQLLNKCSAS